jgi:putrescine transport system substrate-binding protein
MIDAEITGDPSIYPPPEVMERLYISTIKTPKVDRAMNRTWTEIKTSQ